MASAQTNEAITATPRVTDSDSRRRVLMAIIPTMQRAIRINDVTKPAVALRVALAIDGSPS